MGITVDSGACETVVPTNACPQVRVSPSEASRRGDKYEVANGNVIPNVGEKRCRVMTAGSRVEKHITFQCADVDMPVLSSRKLCEAGREVLYKKNGGVSIDTKTGQTSKIVQRGRVYYLKLHVLRPAGHGRAEGFGRQA